ncbi:MAG: PIN domain-containing protein [Candidatus Azobacteroides sp.]|nr:PIN domain-containing protein [Candidatus Azobacteroides sp.]
MRYYLDTNILIFVLSSDKDELNTHTLDILEDYSNTFYLSTIVLKELILLYKERKLEHLKYKTYKDLFVTIDELKYEIKQVTKKHLFSYAELTPIEEHKDPNDHLIIAQSISDKIPLISSDLKFEYYINQGLQLVFNKR